MCMDRVLPFPTQGVYGQSEGFRLTGLFHPWAQWDLGVDTWENSSRRAVVAVAVVVALERARPS